ncbi:hypothetical protein J2S01_001585 [Pectinatus haikarae]|uniref:Uncharacterized protein n=1 Tax=Pectinatus haikarae TaxID=349096 RepID=A0ABT9Y8K5_9FIRM|nr:hypothetical protein [Pectinatus haikarae]
MKSPHMLLIYVNSLYLEKNLLNSQIWLQIKIREIWPVYIVALGFIMYNKII